MRDPLLTARGYSRSRSCTSRSIRRPPPAVSISISISHSVLLSPRAHHPSQRSLGALTALGLCRSGFPFAEPAWILHLEPSSSEIRPPARFLLSLALDLTATRTRPALCSLISVSSASPQLKSTTRMGSDFSIAPETEFVPPAPRFIDSTSSALTSPSSNPHFNVYPPFLVARPSPGCPASLFVQTSDSIRIRAAIRTVLISAWALGNTDVFDGLPMATELSLILFDTCPPRSASYT
ncbi:hypothetical protein B0H13DRAFT_2324402 [Mycena leptocephala]|nr:hypothetical protein B0H13DRAFT_2324402 [Mycena leptocephala]